jgi:hypothetical protein
LISPASRGNAWVTATRAASADDLPSALRDFLITRVHFDAHDDRFSFVKTQPHAHPSPY